MHEIHRLAFDAKGTAYIPIVSAFHGDLYSFRVARGTFSKAEFTAGCEALWYTDEPGSAGYVFRPFKPSFPCHLLWMLVLRLAFQGTPDEELDVELFYQPRGPYRNDSASFINSYGRLIHLKNGIGGFVSTEDIRLGTIAPFDEEEVGCSSEDEEENPWDLVNQLREQVKVLENKIEELTRL